MKKQLTSFFTEYSLQRITITYTTGVQFEAPKKMPVTFPVLLKWLAEKGKHYPSVNQFLLQSNKEQIETILQNFLNEIV